jgi:hypothetical protein
MPDFQYVNPFSIYFVTNTNQESNSSEGSGNLMLSMDARIHPFSQKALLWSQVAIDDFQVDDSTAIDQEPAHWAIDAGASCSDPLPVKIRHHIALRYRYLSKWMYTVLPANTVQGDSYTWLGKSLGFPVIDGDELELSAAVYGRNWWTAGAGIAYGRQDTGTVSTSWPIDSATGTLGYRDEPSLSKRKYAEKSFSIKLYANGYIKDYAVISLNLDNRFVRNKNHVLSGKYEYDPRIAVSISCHYSNFFLKFNRRRAVDGNAH